MRASITKRIGSDIRRIVEKSLANVTSTIE